MKTESLKLLRSLAFVVIIALVVLSVATHWFYQSQEHRIRDRAFAELNAIGELKANEITRWRAERLADAKVLAEGPFLQDAIQVYRETPTPEGVARILKRFDGIRQYYDYDELLLVDKSGRFLISTASRTTFPDPPTESLKQAFEQNEPVITDIHESPNGMGPHLSIIVPVPLPDKASDPPDSGIILICSASRYLYPVIQNWPTQAQTAETLLVRCEGDHVRYLSDLLHQPGSGMNFSIPITSNSLPAIQAVQGFEGVMEGTDYRGIPVLAYMCQIPDSTWAMVAKQDTSEIFAAWHIQSRIILLLFAVLTLCVVAVGAAILHRYHQQHYKTLYYYEAKLNRDLGKHRVILNAIGDAVIATDNEGRVEFLNPAAKKVTGWSNADAVGKPLDGVFHTINEQTRHKLKNPVEDVLREGLAVHLATETRLISKDGTERPIAGSVAPIRDEALQTTGVVLVLHDLTVEQNYKLLFEKMLNGFASHEIICNASGTPVDYRFLDVNPAFEHMTGLKAKDVIGKTVMEVLPKTESEWINRYGHVALTGEPILFENYAQDLDKFFTVSAFRTLPNHFATIFTDITEAKNTEDALKDSENRYHSLTDDVLDNAEIGTFVLNAQFKIVWVNKAMARYFGFNREAAIEADKHQLIHEQIAGIFENPKQFEDKVLATYNDNTYVEGFTCHVLPADGREERWLQHSSQPITSGIFAGGRVEHYYDITAIKQASEKLAQAAADNEWLVAAIEQSQDAIVITDAEAKIQYINKTFERVTGYSRSEVIGQNPRILQSKNHDPAFYLDMWKQLKEGKSVFIRFVNKRKDGTLFTEDASLSPVMNTSGEIVNYVGVKRDITERLKMEERLSQTQKMETVGRLAGGIAHDFNNMLGVIVGNAELLLHKLLPDNPLREEVEAIINAANRSSDITRQLLTFARKQVIKPQILEINETVENCLKLLRRLIGENIELIWKADCSACHVKMDAVQIDQILTNLCINARDAIDNIGTITIKTEPITLTAKDCEPYDGCDPGNFIVLSVTDTGAGMPPEVLSHAFEPFFSQKTDSDGTGLGLATVHGIVYQNGGFIHAESQLDKGTTFLIYLPVHAKSPTETDLLPENKTPRGEGETVLIVEDETMLLKLTETMLTRLGYHVLTAATPDSAIKQAKENIGNIDLLLSDVIMSKMNGKELAERIRTIHPQICILFMSGYTSDIIAPHGVLEDGVHFIPKPFTLNDIAVHVRNCLENK